MHQKRKLSEFLASLYFFLTDLGVRDSATCHLSVMLDDSLNTYKMGILMTLQGYEIFLLFSH